MLLPRTLLRPATTFTTYPSLFLHPIKRTLTSTTSRMASPTPITSLTLDPQIWNANLYTSIHTFWFQDLPRSAKRQNDATRKRWWGLGRSEADLAAIDSECREKFSEAIESISPEQVSLPKWEGYDIEGKRAKEISKVFLEEIEGAVEEGGEEKGADRLMSLMLLLDQIPRHLFREGEGLRRVYEHYDRITWAVLKSSREREPRLDETEAYVERPVFWSWFHMPYMHAEDLRCQEEVYEGIVRMQEKFRGRGDEETAKDLEAGRKASESHLEIVKRFGRFAHRNEALGRASTKEEVEWLKTGETFGVKQKGKE